MATKLMARMSSDFAKVRTSVSRPTGSIMAPPQPCRMRHATSRWMLVRDAAQERAEREDADGGGEHAARAEAVGHPAADGNEYREAQRVAREHRLHVERRHLQRVRDRRHGRVQDRRVERFHEEAHGHEPGQKPLGGGARLLASFGSGGWHRARQARAASTMLCASSRSARRWRSSRKLSA